MRGAHADTRGGVISAMPGRVANGCQGIVTSPRIRSVRVSLPWGTKVMTPAQLEAMLRLPGPERYAHFLVEAAGAREVWGLWDDGWALAEGSRGQRVLPIWPGREYAERCAVGLWSGYEPRAISLDELFDQLMPHLALTGTELGVFYTPSGKGVLPGHERLEEDLRAERANIA